MRRAVKSLLILADSAIFAFSHEFLKAAGPLFYSSVFVADLISVALGVNSIAINLGPKIGPKIGPRCKIENTVIKLA